MKKLTLRIELCNSTPLVWRECVVSSEMDLEDLHLLIQDVMGWEDCHEHMFKKGKKIYMQEHAIEEMKVIGLNYIDECSVGLDEIFTRKNSKISYEYDFGDSWLHEITLIDQEPCNELFTPYCTNGAENCPPEDCGGIIGYQYHQEILKNPKHKEYKDTKKYYSSYMKPFDLKIINKNLKDYFHINSNTEKESYEDMINFSTEELSSIITHMNDSEVMIDLVIKIIRHLSPENQEIIRQILNDDAKAETKLIPISFNDTNKHN